MIKSYDTNGILVKRGKIKDDGYYQKGIVRKYARANDVVTDEILEFQSQDDADVASNGMSWEDAKKYCEDLELDGKGWRVPLFTELVTLIDYGRYVGDGQGSKGALDAIFENVNTQEAYWTTSYVFNKGFSIEFGYGSDDTDYKDTLNSVRCVRSVNR